VSVGRSLAILVAAVVFSTALAGAASQAGPQANKLNKRCAISASGVEFGIYDTLNGTPTDSSGSVTYACRSTNVQRSQNVIISIDQGRAGSFERAMTGPVEQLHYNLYLDVGRTQIWGDGSSGTVTLQGKVPPSGKATTATVYARVAPRQNVSAGRYTDGLVVTIQF